jgi:hypothetical protein
MTAETNRRLKLAIRVLDATFTSRTPRVEDLEALYALAESSERDSQPDELACIVVHRELARNRAGAQNA